MESMIKILQEGKLTRSAAKELRLEIWSKWIWIIHFAQEKYPVRLIDVSEWGQKQKSYVYMSMKSNTNRHKDESMFETEPYYEIFRSKL